MIRIGHLRIFLFLGALSVAAAILSAGPWGKTAAAEDKPPRLAIPVDCTPDVDCWVVNYVDLDPSSDTKDYACGKATYDNHKGTDFAIRDKNVMRAGVKVLAAAPGIVMNVRDGMKDLDVLDGLNKELVRKRECGNGVSIDHGGGWVTQYCHLRRGSVRVKKGQHVETGAPLGMVGQSGMAAFPHLHIQLSRDKILVDPFIGPDGKETCKLSPNHVWSDEAISHLAYKPTAIYLAGFAAKPPKAKAIHDGHHQDEVLSHRAPALVFWSDVFNIKAKDRVTQKITKPDGTELIVHSKVMSRTQARRMFFAGKPRKGLFWDKGIYKGETRIERTTDDGKTEIFTATRSVTLR